MIYLIFTCLIERLAKNLNLDFNEISGEKGMCEKFEVRYNGTEDPPSKYNVAIGTYQYLGTRKDNKCTECRGVYVRKGSDSVSLIHRFWKVPDNYDGWQGIVSGFYLVLRAI